MNKKIVIIGGWADSLVNFRGELIRGLGAAGYEVTAMAAPANFEVVKRIEALGCRFLPFPIRRNGLNPWQDLCTLWALIQMFRVLKPDVVLSYTIKPVIWGGVASRSVEGIRFFALITGLGYAFQGQGWTRRGLTKVITFLYRKALKYACAVFFQNTDNRDEFLNRGIVLRDKCRLVNGSGVNIDYFSQSRFFDGAMVFLLIARLLKEKGIKEYLAAAHAIKQKYPGVIFNLLGPEDPSPDGISLEEVQECFDEAGGKYLGVTDDVRTYISQSSVYVLPSYHEGTPRTVLEAMAMGRPIITTDAPGCRETVRPKRTGGGMEGDGWIRQGELKIGANGILIPVKNVPALVEAMEYFIRYPDEIVKMGRESRLYAEGRYDVHKVNAVIMREMGLE